MFPLKSATHLLPLRLIKPNGDLPKLNDDINGMNIGDIRDLLEFTNRNWDDPIISYYIEMSRLRNPVHSIKSAIWMESFEINNWIPQSTDFLDFGVSIIRMNGVFVLIDYGPHGGWHGHRDKLNIEISSSFGDIIRDPGNVPYSLDSSREWYRSTYAHSTVILGDNNQLETSGNLVHSDYSSNYSSIVVSYSDSRYNATVFRGIVVIPLSENSVFILDFFKVILDGNISITRVSHFSDAFHNDEISSLNSLNSDQYVLPLPSEIEKYVDLKKDNRIEKILH